MGDSPPSTTARGRRFSLASAPAPFLGGTLHAFPVDALVFAGTDAGGLCSSRETSRARLPVGASHRGSNAFLDLCRQIAEGSEAAHEAGSRA